MTILLVKIEIIVQIRSGMIDFTFGITLTGFSHSDVTYIDLRLFLEDAFPLSASFFMPTILTTSCLGTGEADFRL